MTEDPLRNRKVLIWGIGRHGGGIAAARWCAARGAQVRILDRKPPLELGEDGQVVLTEGWPSAIGDGSHPWLSESDLIVPSPAIPPRAWPDQHAPIRSPEALALATHTGPRVAVTGTKGKSTTTRILADLLGWEPVGNGWEPLPAAVDRLGASAPLVCELSSFQLWYLAESRPRFAAGVLTNLGIDHLDWHPDVAHYRACKTAMFAWCDAVACGPGGEAVQANRVPAVAYDDGGFRDQAGRLLARRRDLPLLGDHNVANTRLAIAIALHLGVPLAEIAVRLRRVRALDHRLQTVFDNGLIRWIDDSIATTPDAAAAGIAAIPGQMVVILGGSDKGATWAGLAHAVAARGAMALTIGTTGAAIAEAVLAAGGRAREVKTLAVAVTEASQLLTQGGVVLLSPACASLDQFSDYRERGHRFTELARSSAQG